MHTSHFAFISRSTHLFIAVTLLLTLCFPVQTKANATVVQTKAKAAVVQTKANATAVQEQDGLTPLQTATIKTVTSATRSEDGVHVAYTLHTPADPLKANRPAQNHLYLLNTETGETRPLYQESSAAAVAFRPGHNSVTFLAVRSGDSTRSLYEIPLEGGDPERVHSHQTHIMTYAWSSDGERLAYTAPEELEEPTSDLPFKPEFYEESQPDRPLFIAEPGRDTEPFQVDVDGAVYMVQWSPDNDRIALTAAPTSSIDNYYMSQKVKIADSGTGEILAEIDNDGKIGQIEWSPDGQRLALRAGRDRFDPIDGRILIAAADGGTPEMIDGDYEGKYEQIAWLTDNEIHFIASESVWSVYGSIAPDGSRKEIHLDDGVPALNSFEAAGDGSVLFTGSRPEHPTEVWLLGQGEVTPERVTWHNSSLEEVSLGRQEVVSWESRDGEWELDGLFIWPVGHDGESPVPVVTVVHGGPEAHYSNGWVTNYSTPGQMAAARGYGVFYPNYRGSTGRGIEFVHSSQADAGGAEFDDIVDGIDHLIAEGIADEERIGVTGGSYGGYASAWMSTYYSDRFAAAVMFVGVSNNLSKWGTSDIPDELYYVHSRERIWDHWMKYLERSPIYWVERAETPILITHGSEDTRVHPAQSMELYRHLKVRKRDLPVRLIWYPGEGHGNINAASRLDYILRMLEWFDTYLMTGSADAELPDRDLEVPSLKEAEAGM